jgi:hypothetical protein
LSPNRSRWHTRLQIVPRFGQRNPNPPRPPRRRDRRPHPHGTPFTWMPRPRAA